MTVSKHLGLFRLFRLSGSPEASPGVGRYLPFRGNRPLSVFGKVFGENKPSKHWLSVITVGDGACSQAPAWELGASLCRQDLG